VARMGWGEVFTGFWLGGPKVRDHWKDLDIGGRIEIDGANWIQLAQIGSSGGLL
jgi:hypothetical protein